MNGLMMKYFVLKPSGNDGYALASRIAMLIYADVIAPVDLELANDLRAWVARESVGRNERVAQYEGQNERAAHR